MVNFSSSGAFPYPRLPVSLLVYLVLALVLAVPADAEHLSQKHSHARKSLEHPGSYAKRAPAPQLDSARPVSGSLLSIGADGVGIIVGGDDGLIEVTLPPDRTSAPVESETTSTSDEAPTTDTATATEAPATSDATTSTSESTSSPTTTAPAISESTSVPTTTASTSPPTTPSTSESSTSESSSDLTTIVSSSPAESSAASSSDLTTTVTTETASNGPTTSCVVGLSLLGIGVDAACVPISTSVSTSSILSQSSVPATTIEATTNAPPAPTTSSAGSDSSVGLSTITSESSPIPATSEPCDGLVSVNVRGISVCVPSLPATTEQPEPSSGPVTSPDPSDSNPQPSPEPSPPSESGSSSDEPPTTCTGLLCGILPDPTSLSSGQEEPTDTSSASGPPETSVPGTTASESEGTTCSGLLCGILPTPTSSEDTTVPSGSATSEEIPPATTDSESCSGLPCSITSLPPPSTTTTPPPGENSTDIVSPPITTPPPDTTSELPPIDNSTTTSELPPIDNSTTTSELPPVDNSTTTITTDDFNTTTISPPITTTTTTPGENSTVTTGNSTSTDTSIAFPTGNTTTSDLVTLTSSYTISTSVASEFSFLTQTTLLFSETTSTASPSLATLTNPDEATTSATLESAVTGATVSSVPLPSGLPARIYPAEGGVSTNTDLEGYAPVSILFDSSLSWPFVATNTDSAAQIFAYFPVCLQVALGITSDQVRTFALQAYKTSQYRSPSDVTELRTLYITYIPANNVTALEQAIKAKQSDLYTRTTGISNQLARRIDVTYSVTSAPDPISNDPNQSSGTNSSATSTNTRRDAIIGICSALGGIAVCILGFLLYRNFKRRQEVAHHRLVEPQTSIGPTPGQEFDRDSIGGQRRRSFYYAEDSLRGFSQPGPREEMYAHQISSGAAGGGMRERRTIAPGTISAPILRDNTLNW